MASPADSPGSDALGRIDHVVALMLENRSFDNLLGWLYEDEPPPRGQDFEGLQRWMWNPLDNVDSDGIPFIEKVPVRKNGEPNPRDRRGEPGPPDFHLPSPDPGEGYRDTNHQLFQHYDVALLYPPEPTNMGFVNNYRDALLNNTYTFGEPPTDPREIMVCFTPEQVPVLSALARSFAVCDQWYGSVPSQTLPNRHFFHAATSDGQVNNKPDGICRSPTIFNVMQKAIEKEDRDDLSWRVYGGTSRGRLFSLTRLVMELLHDDALDPNFLPIERFYEDAASGKLPSYAFLEPQFHHPGNNDQHPPLDIRPGEKLIADVYEAVASSPCWENTLLVITYDEHGGCFDHVPPPGGATAPDRDRADGQHGFRFNRFGVRVPTVLVSPWIEAGTVCRAPGRVPFDHTSVIATLRERFDLPKLTDRDGAAPHLGCALNRDTPREDRPSVEPLPLPADDETSEPRTNDLHRLVAEIVERLTGSERPETAEELFDFIHDEYEARFGKGQTGGGAGGRSFERRSRG